MKKTFLALGLLILCSLAIPLRSAAQCSSPNYSFRSGETLMYDLYFNWKFVWIKVGTASMNITRSVYDGEPAYRAYLITRGSERADKFFIMRDTLTAYTSLDLVPKKYTKNAHEGKNYYRDEVLYSYPNGLCQVDMKHQRNNNEPKFKTQNSKYCAYDMISMLLRARSFDPSNFKEGHRIKFLMADGKNCEWQSIIYRGKKKFKMENSNTTYRCLVFSFLENEDGKEKEIVTFYVTDDKNHLPVRLDMNLNFGTAKAFLTGARGLRNPQDAKLK
ncbi:MAG: DUF3108 domain-containing protein [Bacteroidaceae bacterium]|nr:DUF3108 domain-containing protein [Bacteroidaceae bacterium]